MAKVLPEIEARNILEKYDGFNNQLLIWKRKFETIKNFTLTRNQSEYVLKYHNIKPKVAKKHLTLFSSYGEKIMEERLLTKPVEKIWCEKLLCESDKAYHIWGKVLDGEKEFYSFWLPKASIVQEEKKLDRVIDYSKYDHRPLMEHQKIGVEKLLVNDKFILADDQGLGKGLVKSTLIYTSNGKKRIEELTLDDMVIGSDGKSYKINGIFPQGKKQTYKVTFNDGYSTICDGDHLWTVTSSSNSVNRKSRNPKYVTLSTNQLIDKNLVLEHCGDGHNKNKNYKFKTYYKSNDNTSKWQIPTVQPIEFENKEKLPIDPYLLGLCLGDGTMNSTTIRFCCHKDDYDFYGGILKSSNIKENKPSRNLRHCTIKVANALKKLKLDNTRSHNKFIPDIYKYSSIENRLSILQGLMDTDGHCMVSKNNTFSGTEFSTISERLCDDVAEIVHTLGGVCRKNSRRSFYKKNGIKVECSISYRLNIKLPKGMNPFRLKRKCDRYNEPQKYKVGRYISNIEKIGIDETICISVDSPDKLYVIEHGIVTHNTTTATIAALESGAKKILIVCPASLKINWKREIECYTDRKILIMEGRKWGSTFDFYIINYDILKNYHTIDKKEKSEDLQLLVNAKFDLAIVDEAHNLSNAQALRSKLLNDVLATIPKLWLLTGTPMTSRPINYFNLLRLVGSPLTLNWQAYVKRYCKGFQFKSGNRKIWSTSGASNLDELRERTKGVVLRRLKTDVLDLPEKIINPIFLELHNTSYDEKIEEFLRISKEEKSNETISVTLNRLMSLRQIIAMEKVPYTCELIDRMLEQDKKIIVFTNFTNSLEMIYEKYPKISVVLDGRMNKTKRQDSIDRFQNDKKIKLFIGNIKAAGVGITLTEAEVEIMNDLSFVPSDHAQAEDRAFRYGQKKNVLVYYPVFENTIEMIVYNILQRKKNIIDQVMGDGEYSESFASELIKSIL